MSILNNKMNKEHFERLSPIREPPRPSIAVPSTARRQTETKLNSCRMYESLSKLREYHFRLQLYEKSKAEVFQESLTSLFSDELGPEPTIAETLCPTF
jgi:hypothetical protein